jgi:hypothetical protein
MCDRYPLNAPSAPERRHRFARCSFWAKSALMRYNDSNNVMLLYALKEGW